MLKPFLILSALVRSDRRFRATPAGRSSPLRSSPLRPPQPPKFPWKP